MATVLIQRYHKSAYSTVTTLSYVIPITLYIINSYDNHYTHTGSTPGHDT